MKEDFLHYVWKFQKFAHKNLITTEGEKLSILKVGIHNFNSGPDFFNGQVIIKDQRWVGNIEIHLKSSHWYLHHHEKDNNYDNVILHVVWQHDVEVYRKDQSIIPTLILKSIVDEKALANYNKLFVKNQHFINCENQINNVDNFIIENWLERLYVERLQQKANIIKEELIHNNNHWEASLFNILCKNFGLKVNADSFYSIAQSVDFSIIKKCKNTYELEAILFGQAGFFEKDIADSYFIELKEKYHYLKSKFKLNNQSVIEPNFFRLRPANFPTIRLSQIAFLYNKKKSLFAELMDLKHLCDYYNFFNISSSEYWENHYSFGVKSSKSKKKLTTKLIDLLLVNSIIPLRYSYAKFLGEDVSEEILKLALEIKLEENKIIKSYKKMLPWLTNSLQSQALLQLKNEYCNKNKCLQCAIGTTILKSDFLY